MMKADKNNNFLNNEIISNETKFDEPVGYDKIQPEAEPRIGSGNFVPEPPSSYLANVEVNSSRDNFTAKAKEIEEGLNEKQDQKLLPKPSDTAEPQKIHQLEILDERFRVLEEGWGYYSRKKKPSFYRIEFMRFE